jgi:hypothetical protein
MVKLTNAMASYMNAMVKLTNTAHGYMDALAPFLRVRTRLFAPVEL